MGSFAGFISSVRTRGSAIRYGIADFAFLLPFGGSAPNSGSTGFWRKPCRCTQCVIHTSLPTRPASTEIIDHIRVKPQRNCDFNRPAFLRTPLTARPAHDVWGDLDCGSQPLQHLVSRQLRIGIGRRRIRDRRVLLIRNCCKSALSPLVRLSHEIILSLRHIF